MRRFCERIKGLQSRYAIRLYELLIKWRSVGKTNEISLDELRKHFGLLGDEYMRMHHFKARVLDLAISQINEYTDITAEYEQHKQGRTITGFTFKFKQKAKSKAVKADNTERD
ncbi:replication initiation protein [Mycobacterium tuberculosis]|nr:RepB family plasmid replication initiator protein [Mycobacterium tuberculosis]MBP0556234.1 replication initiation protein [Mycobacterium tuberculosis]